ncbi:MAG: hypothetical protein ACRDRN_11255 [Sciscionella sp.]
MLEDALRVLLTRQADVAQAQAPFSLPVGRDSGLRPGIDLEDSEHLAEVLGDNQLNHADR